MRPSAKGDTPTEVEVPMLDLCVMNPPFTRSVGGNLLFGSLPDEVRRVMQGDLKRLVDRQSIPANVTAGLGTVFTALGHRLVKPNGQLALVLPRAVLSGVAWTQTRDLIARDYHVRAIIVSHQPNGWNFSENTKLSECLMVARRLGQGETAEPTKVINLWRKPKNSIEALAVAKQVVNTPGASITGVGTDDLMLGPEKFGEVVLAAADRIRAGHFNDCCAFAQTDLSRVSVALQAGRLYIPGRGIVGDFPVRPLRDLGELGPDVRDIGDGFRVSVHATQYAAFLGHATGEIVQLEQRANAFLGALARARAGRPLRDANLLWRRAGRLLVAERLRLNTARVVAVCLAQKVLSNTWWPVAVDGANAEERRQREKILALWMNSTLGVVALIAARVDTEGAWVKLKKPILHSLIVLDPSGLTGQQRAALERLYDAVADSAFERLPQVAEDRVRARIDSGIMNALGVDTDLGVVRAMLGREPILSLGGVPISAAEAEPSLAEQLPLLPSAAAGARRPLAQVITRRDEAPPRRVRRGGSRP